MEHYKRLKVLVPTKEEAMYVKKIVPEGSELVISGVGMVRTAATVARIAVVQPDAIIILAGIAGAYPHSGLKRGDCVLVGRERVADQGAFRDGDFVELYSATYDCQLAQGLKSLPVVRSNSVNAAGAAFIDNGADYMDGEAMGIENMEGAALFGVCEELGISYLEVRAISNITTDDRSKWQIDTAAEALAEAVKKVIDEIDF